MRKGNHKTLLGDVFELEGRRGETGRLCDELWIEVHQATLLRRLLPQAE